MSESAGRLAGRAAIVTGAARGLGEAIARRLLAESCRVLLADVDGDDVHAAARTLMDEHGDRCRAIRADVSDTASVVAMVGAAEQAWGRLDILVNNAGIADFTSFETITAGDLDRVLAVNLNGALIATRAATDLLARSPAPRVLNLASIMGYRVAPDMLPYCVSKGAITTLTACLAAELAPRGIRVNAVAPGCFPTRMALTKDGASEYDTEWFKEIFIKWERLPLGRVGRLEELAAAAYFFCSDDSSYVTGQTLLVDGGISIRF